MYNYQNENAKSKMFGSCRGDVEECVNQVVNDYTYQFEDHDKDYDEDEIKGLDIVKVNIVDKIYDSFCDQARLSLFWSLCNQPEVDDPENLWNGDDTFESLAKVFGDTLFMTEDFMDPETMEEMAEDEVKEFRYEIECAVEEYDAQREDESESDYCFA